jgi:hypothetical protein
MSYIHGPTAASDELTSAEEVIVGQIASLTGNSLKYLRVDVGETGVEWATVGAASVEGTSVLSTGEVGGTKFLREDGDGTCSWQTITGGGDVLKVGTPVNNQVGVWTGDGTIEGDAAFTFDTTTDVLYVGGTIELGHATQNTLSASGGILSIEGTAIVKGTGSANELAYWSGTNTIGTLAVATYPSLVELAYVKGVTSGIQGQINAKGVGDMTLAGVQSITGLKTFDASKLAMKGSSTGVTTIATANAGASDFIITLPAVAGTVALTADKLSAFAATTSLELKGIISDETGSGALVFGTAPSFTTSILPASNDGAAIGAITTGEWSDLFLAEGGVINWDNGDLTMTQAGNLLTIAGGNVKLDNLETTGSIELGAVSDTTLARVSAGVVSIEGNNIVTVASTAMRTLVLSAAGGSPTTTIGCAAPAKVEAGTNDVDYYTLDFDTTTEERAFWVVAMPDNYDGGTVTAKFYWTNASGSSTQTVDWGIKARSFADDETIDQAFGSEITTTDTWLAQGDVHISPASSAITIGGTPAGGELVVFNVGRKVASDNMTGDARLMMVKIEYGINAYSD